MDPGGGSPILAAASAASRCFFGAGTLSSMPMFCRYSRYSMVARSCACFFARSQALGDELQTVDSDRASPVLRRFKRRLNELHFRLRVFQLAEAVQRLREGHGSKLCGGPRARAPEKQSPGGMRSSTAP
mmetsp:Transcript_28642/g.95051  ORF Transcript_28642/g.95051 Transcript_28642/m.95051 type:complete len:129 (-) Transcript_28642:15-401(-)